MLKIHNNNFKKYRIPLISAFVVIGGMFLFSYLTYIPTQTFAADSTETRTLSDITKMQEMNARICENTKEIGITKRIEDVRDGTLYWVAKLADGQCWMTQNLDYNIPPDGVMDPKLGNLPDDFTRISGDVYKFTTNVEGWNHDNGILNYDKITYYDPGLMLKKNPATLDNCTGKSITSLNNDTCIAQGWLDVSSGYTAKTDAPQSDAPEVTSATDKVLSGTTYDAHYLSGNYYSFNAATAGYGTQANLATSESKSEYSICPKGWRLPLSGTSNNNEDGSFHKLLSQYGFTSSTSNGSAYLYDAPFYYLRIGYVEASGVNSGYINGGGNAGYYWSSVVSSADTAYYLSISNNDVGSSHSYSRSRGYAVRCVHDPTIIASENLSGPTVEPDSNQANVAITVAPVISIDATSGMSESIDFTQVAEGNITAKVSSNQAYQVLLSTEQSNLEQNPVLANFNIPMVTNDTEITAGVNSWGVKKTLSVATGGTAGDDTTLTNTLYSPIGIGDDKVLFYKSSGAESKTLVFPVAISVDATLPSGIYSTQVTITAVAN